MNKKVFNATESILRMNEHLNIHQHIIPTCRQILTAAAVACALLLTIPSHAQCNDPKQVEVVIINDQSRHVDQKSIDVDAPLTSKGGCYSTIVPNETPPCSDEFWEEEDPKMFQWGWWGEPWMQQKKVGP